MKSMQVLWITSVFIIHACQNITPQSGVTATKLEEKPSTEVIVLGTAQDAGYPQAGCQNSCCQKVYEGTLPPEKVSCIAVVDNVSAQYWVIDATPDFPEQLRVLESRYPNYSLGGIFLTHAHIGHYTGLMHLGREVMGANKVKVYAMPLMDRFLRTNGPWSQLVSLENISIIPLQSDSTMVISEILSITPMKVPHRDEYSETVGFSIEGLKKRTLFIPDIDKWEKWDKDIKAQIQQHHIALLDGSFFMNGEIPGRDMAEIPHPFVEESMNLFKDLNSMDRAKIYFIHFNHTNPILDPGSDASKAVYANGMSIARSELVFGLD